MLDASIGHFLPLLPLAMHSGLVARFSSLHVHLMKSFITGNPHTHPVTSSTFLTGTPAFSMAVAVPPVEMISKPAVWRPWVHELKTVCGRQVQRWLLCMECMQMAFWIIPNAPPIHTLTSTSRSVLSESEIRARFWAIAAHVHMGLDKVDASRTW